LSPNLPGQSLKFVNLAAIWYISPRFGILCQETLYGITVNKHGSKIGTNVLPCEGTAVTRFEEKGTFIHQYTSVVKEYSKRTQFRVET
jgi:hypothetical protein